MGEVPDSDDEDGYGSDEAKTVPGSIGPTITNTETPTKVIWEFTGSENEAGLKNAIASTKAGPATHHESVESSPLSSAKSIDDLPELDEILQDISEDADRRDGDAGYPTVDDVSQSYVQITAPTPMEYSMTDQDVLRPDEGTVDRLEPVASQDLGHMADLEAIQHAAVRLERSLRPRKPIQEHPYLLENAHYSSLFRKHGVRPVQMAATIEKRRREATALDGDFEDDSQESTLPHLPDSSLRDSRQDHDAVRELDIFDISSSSPPKTSPWVNRATVSSRPSSPGETDNTSVLDQDLPTMQDLLSRTKHRLSNTTRRERSAPSSVAQKRRRRDVIDSDTAEPPHTESLATFGESAVNANERTLSASGPLPAIPRLQYNKHPSYTSRPPSPQMPDAETISSEDEQKRPGKDDGGSDSSGEEGGVYMNSIGRRIKGVLPASWLRLDEKTSRDKAQKNMQRRQRSRVQEAEHRRGIAQIRQTITSTSTPGAASTTPWFSDDSEDEQASAPRTTDELFHNQTQLTMLPQEREGSSAIMLSDGEESVIEDNSIDLMHNGEKRQRKPSSAQTQKRQKLSNHSRKMHGVRQSKITSHLQGQKRVSASGRGKQTRSRKRIGTDPKRFGKPEAVKPPRLGVLDVIDSNAPPFLRIAARTAKRRPDQGRSSPSKKSIRLASRADNIDAVSVLNNWRAGFIQQRYTVSEARLDKRSKKPRQPLSESTGNKLPHVEAPKEERRKLFSNAPRKFVKQASNGGRVQYGPGKHAEAQRESRSNLEERVREEPAIGDSDALRPAQLEVGESHRAAAMSFYKQKKVIDRLYRRYNQHTFVETISERSYSVRPLAAPEDPETLQQQLTEKPTTKKRRPRKSNRPVRIDVDAAQFQHAADPLPIQYAIELEPLPQAATASKLCGLGPYGTIYTTHFEIFPLDPGVYFHESTLMGSGAIESLTRFSDTLLHLEPRQRVTFELGNQTLRWSAWNEQISSEFGVVLDTIADEIGSTNGSYLETATATNCSIFLSTYLTESLSFVDESAVKSFVARVLDVFRRFNGRIVTHMASWTISEKERGGEVVARVYDSLVLMAYVAIILCRSHSSLMSEQFQVEDLLRDLTQTSVRALLGSTDQLLRTYSTLQTISARERGLRYDAPAIHSWVLIMQVLDLARIPRGGFWEVLKPILAPKEEVAATDVQSHEQIWHSVFTILPLCEFTPSGILVPGRRHEISTDGWIIPQQLLRQIFILYGKNEHQAASFNDYCRALLSRCHYLVQQWGWRRSGSVVGVIFDFFGSQNLAHLRNEEVHSSPKFLEKLADSPSLAVEPTDKCFHIFLKLLALSIRKLRATGSIKDVRNLVARTIPNHNRQHLKEQTVYERDLAALRNHHDLLGTLFWAAPPDLRPGVALLQRLVAPSTSHKEACLINIRSWNQLARFIAVSAEVTTTFKPFLQWRNTFFQESLRQFDSIASDIHQQLHSLPKDVTQTIDNDMVNSMISLNKKAVIDILRASVLASLDVMRRTPNLESASFCFNCSQLQHVFKHFSVPPPEFDWATLRAALSTLETFVARIDEFKDNEESQQSESQLLNSAQADDAMLVLDNDLSKTYFSMVRCLLSTQSSSETLMLEYTDRSWCVEKAVVLAARTGARLANGGLVRLPDMFKGGRYGLFEGQIQKLPLERRKYLVLYVATLLQNKIDDFGELHFNLCELWTLSLVKPHGYLDYQNQLREQLKQRAEFYVPGDTLVLPSEPDYNSNRDLFEFAVSAMRRSMLDSGPGLRRTLLGEYSKALKLVMEQMKDDLKAALSDPTKHYTYVAFTRHIISLIRTHGSEICAVDDFYYQISPEYSPSSQDPQLQVAAMVSYGLRITEGDEKVTQQLFFFLFNNFKMAMVSDNLHDEARKLVRGMRDAGILHFIVGKMLPAALCASGRNQTTFPLLDVYVLATWHLLKRLTLIREISESEIPIALTVTTAVLLAFRGMLESQPTDGMRRIHILSQAIAVVNALWPSVYGLSLNNIGGPAWTRLVRCFEVLNMYIEVLKTNIGHRFATGDYAAAPSQLLRGLADDDLEIPGSLDAQVTGFADNIVQDAEKNWVESADRITARTPAKPREEVPQGICNPKWDAEKVLRGLNNHINEWRYWWDRFKGVTHHTETQDGVMF